MGKKRTVAPRGQSADRSLQSRALARGPKRKISAGVLHIQATYNNTIASLTDTAGNVIMATSSGALGFKGAKKSTPYAAGKVGELLGEKAQLAGLKEISVVVRGVGAGRESVIRSFSGFGIDVVRIQDQTPVPFNGPRAPKPRRI